MNPTSNSASPGRVTFVDFCEQLMKFREAWNSPAVLANPTPHVDALLTAFGKMEGNPDEIETAGMGLRASIMECKLRCALHFGADIEKLITRLPCR